MAQNAFNQILEDMNRASGQPVDHGDVSAVLKPDETTESDLDGFTYVQSYLVDLHYKDDYYSTVDDNKNIVMDSHQINLTQESNSQAIPFKLKRYWDGIDLAGMNLAIHYFTPNTSNRDALEGASSPINVKYDDDNLYFMWLIDDAITSTKGVITFEIIATGVHNNRKYVWRTRPNTQVSVLQGLKISNASSIESVGSYQTFIDAISNIKDEIQKLVQGEGGSGDFTNLVSRDYLEEKLKDYLQKTGDTFLSSGSYDAENQKIILTLNDENSTVIEIPINDILNGLVTEKDLADNYYSKEQIGEIPKTEEGIDQTLINYIDNKTATNLDYVKWSELGEVPKTADGEDQTLMQYIGNMDTAFYRWIINFTLANQTYENYTYKTYQGDGSEFFGDLAKSGNDFFNLYSDISIDQIGLTEESTVEQALGNLVGVESIYEKNDSLLEFFDITDVNDKTGLIENYNNKETGLRDKINSKIIQIKLGLLIKDAPKEEKFYRVSAPVTLSTNPSTKDTITFTEVPVSKQDYSKAESIVKYVNALEDKINNETNTARDNELLLSNDIKVLNNNVQDLVSITDLLNADAETEGSVDWKIAQADISDKLNDYYTQEQIDDIIGDTKGESVVDYVDAAVEAVDVSEELGELAQEVAETYVTKTDAEAYAVATEVAETYATKQDLTTAIANLDIISEADLLVFIEQEEEENGGDQG